MMQAVSSSHQQQQPPWAAARSRLRSVRRLSMTRKSSRGSGSGKAGNKDVVASNDGSSSVGPPARKSSKGSARGGSAVAPTTTTTTISERPSADPTDITPSSSSSSPVMVSPFRAQMEGNNTNFSNGNSGNGINSDGRVVTPYVDPAAAIARAAARGGSGFSFSLLNSGAGSVIAGSVASAFGRKPSSAGSAAEGSARGSTRGSDGDITNSNSNTNSLRLSGHESSFRRGSGAVDASRRSSQASVDDPAGSGRGSGRRGSGPSGGLSGAGRRLSRKFSAGSRRRPSVECDPTAAAGYENDPTSVEDPAKTPISQNIRPRRRISITEAADAVRADRRRSSLNNNGGDDGDGGSDTEDDDDDDDASVDLADIMAKIEFMRAATETEGRMDAEAARARRAEEAASSSQVSSMSMSGRPSRSYRPASKHSSSKDCEDEDEASPMPGRRTTEATETTNPTAEAAEESMLGSMTSLGTFETYEPNYSHYGSSIGNNNSSFLSVSSLKNDRHASFVSSSSHKNNKYDHHNHEASFISCASQESELSKRVYVLQREAEERERSMNEMAEMLEMQRGVHNRLESQVKKSWKPKVSSLSQKVFRLEREASQRESSMSEMERALGEQRAMQERMEGQVAQLMANEEKRRVTMKFWQEKATSMTKSLYRAEKEIERRDGEVAELRERRRIQEERIAELERQLEIGGGGDGGLRPLPPPSRKVDDAAGMGRSYSLPPDESHDEAPWERERHTLGRAASLYEPGGTSSHAHAGGPPENIDVASISLDDVPFLPLGPPPGAVDVPAPPVGPPPVEAAQSRRNSFARRASLDKSMAPSLSRAAEAMDIEEQMREEAKIEALAVEEKLKKNKAEQDQLNKELLSMKDIIRATKEAGDAGEGKRELRAKYKGDSEKKGSSSSKVVYRLECRECKTSIDFMGRSTDPDLRSCMDEHFGEVWKAVQRANGNIGGRRDAVFTEGIGAKKGAPKWSVHFAQHFAKHCHRNDCKTEREVLGCCRKLVKVQVLKRQAGSELFWHDKNQSGAPKSK